jgi:hypothetical protein
VVSELVTFSTTKRARRKRMNPANTRALRRSLRRLQSFERLSSRVSQQLYRRQGMRRSTKRCRTCRKTPCMC